MTNWQGAKLLYQHEMRRSWIGILITILLFAYMSIIFMPLFKDLLGEGEAERTVQWISDLLYMTLLPSMGFVMNRSYMNYWLKDPFTRKLAYLRTLPIGLTAIVLARMLQFITVSLVVTGVFFIAQYSFIAELRAMITPGEYTLFILIWFGYALTIGASYVIAEQLLSGKKYFVACFCYIPFYAALTCLSLLTDKGFLFHTIKAAQQHEVIWAIGSLFIGIATTVIAGNWIRSRLASRNLLN